jgi:hypothetical protein
MNLQKVVAPAQAGAQEFCNCLKILDSGFRRNDRKTYLATFYEAIKILNSSKNATGGWAENVYFFCT